MPEAFRLQTLLDLTQVKLDDATRKLAELIASEQDQARKLSMLTQYRDEYQSRFMDSARGGITPGQLSNFHAFLGKLDDAIRQQQAIVDASRERAQHGQQQWLESRSKLKAFETLSDRHQATQQRKDARNEQKQADDRTPRTPDEQ